MDGWMDGLADEWRVGKALGTSEWRRRVREKGGALASCRAGTRGPRRTS